MEIKSQAQAGTLESSDIMVIIKPVDKGKGRLIELESNVEFQYGDSIHEEVNKLLDQYEIQDVKMHLNDKGALAPVIRARLETAIKRALEIQEGTLTEF